MRWGQTNLTEIDPGRYDADFWRQRWRDTKIQGVIINAGGIVAYYPSAFPQHRATALGERDFYGDIVAQAREDGLVVIARMDSNRADQSLFDAHPEWFTRDKAGTPYKAGPNYIACINSGYYREFLPAVFQEIIERSHPDGFADNSWAGLEASKICYCENCRTAFAKYAETALPEEHDWSDPAYRTWVRWNFERRTEVWAENTRATSAAGGPDCVWIGMISGDQGHEVARFQDLHAIARENGPKIFFVDHQRRTPRDGFMSNADAGKRLHGLIGWDKLMPESMAMYSAGSGFFRATSMPEAEVRAWAASAFAGGIQPWWHHISAVHEDRRQYDTPIPIFAFHERAEKYLVGRTPVAQVAVAWSEANDAFHGTDDAENRAVNPYRGVISALSRARIPYIPVHIDDLDRLGDDVRVLVLPDVAVMTEAEADAVHALAARGVSVVATGETSLKDEEGQLRDDFLLAELFGVHATGSSTGSDQPLGGDIEVWTRHDYVRFDREPRLAGITESDVAAIFAGLERTDIVSFGGRLQGIRVEDAAVLGTYVEPFPFYPPEFAWLPSEPTTTPVITARTTSSGARVAYLAADFDRSAGREQRPDHLTLIANLVRWQLGADEALRVTGAGQIDCNLYAQDGRLVLHLVNTGAASPVPGTLHEAIPTGALEIEISRSSIAGGAIRALVADTALAGEFGPDRVRFTVPPVTDHEVVVIGQL
ncbi:MAG TPA: beta-galactosidase [Gryllotalpicola sp.]